MSTEKFEKLSFLQLISNTEISIPIIQRDYAQGRNNNAEIRNNFLQALLDAFDEPIELDFVYGSKVSQNVLCPLDGQQRLTTLFLLHWYIALMDNKINEYRDIIGICNNNEITDIKFKYETRASAREFCIELIKNDIDFSDSKRLSDVIRNENWYVPFWDYDPTVSAMLVMIDSISDKFKGHNNLWEKLKDDKNPPISFMYVELEKFGLSDDLYIKMNARGKQLTTFENFKAVFEKEIDLKGFEKAGKDEKEKKIEIEDTFSYKIDMDWNDLFWHFGKPDKDSKLSVDSKFLNFINGVAIYRYGEIGDNVRLKELADKSGNVKPCDFPDKEAFGQLVNYFEIYSKYNVTNENQKVYYNAILKTNVNLFGNCKTTLFEDFIDFTEPNYKGRVLFYAQTKYLEKEAEVNEANFDNWMRVIRNIVENSTIDSAPTFCAAIKLVKELSKGCGDIYNYLSENKIEAGHGKGQIREEVLKSKIIIADEKNKAVIHEMEDINFCKGHIDFALYCIDYKENEGQFNIELFTKIKNIFVKYFNENDISNDFRRCLFTIGNNDFYTYWTSWLYAVEASKYCLITSVLDLRDNYLNTDGSYKDYMKELVLKLVNNSIQQIIDDYVKDPKFNNLPNWKKLIIKTPGLLDYSHSHYIASNEKGCWLIPGTRVANNEKGIGKLKEIK